jgi:acyl homoserine lactone synthase/acyl-homoserine lactone synthase
METLDLAPASVHAGTALAAMFAARKRVFVDLLGWELPLREGRFEVDQFDSPDAAYVLLEGPGPDHRGSARLLDTRTPHILGDLFPSLCAGPIPRGPDVREITRFCIEPELSRGDQREARNELVSALAHHAASTGIRTYTAVAGLAWFRQISRFGWECSALGEPREINGETLVGLRITIGADTTSRLAATGIWHEPRYSVLLHQDGVPS